MTCKVFPAFPADLLVGLNPDSRYMLNTLIELNGY